MFCIVRKDYLKSTIPVENYHFRKPDSFGIHSQNIHSVISFVPMQEFILPGLENMFCHNVHGTLSKQVITDSLTCECFNSRESLYIFTKRACLYFSYNCSIVISSFPGGRVEITLSILMLKFH